MSSGLYYRIYPNKIAYKTYGFSKVDKKKADEITQRVSRPTSASKDILTTNYQGSRNSNDNRFQGYLLTHADKPCERSISNLRILEFDRLRLEEYYIEKIFRRLYKGRTISNDKKTIYYEDEDVIKPLRRPQSRPTHVSNKEPEYRSPEDIIDDYEKNRAEISTMKKLTRPTTSTSLKTLGTCTYCIERGLSNRWTGHVTNHEHDVCGKCSLNINQQLKNQTELVRRLRQPTSASQGGVPFCTKLDPEICHMYLGKNKAF